MRLILISSDILAEWVIIRVCCHGDISGATCLGNGRREFKHGDVVRVADHGTVTSSFDIGWVL